MEGMKELEGKKVFIELKNGRRYSATVVKYDNNFFKIIDKYGFTVYIAEKELKLIQEEP